eukprot:911857-Rhodomonas_salina.1
MGVMFKELTGCRGGGEQEREEAALTLFDQQIRPSPPPIPNYCGWRESGAQHATGATRARSKNEGGS